MSGYRSDFFHGIMFHHFHNENNLQACQGSITAKEFEKILKYIGTDNILSPYDWLSKLSTGKLRKNDYCVTFDDALKSQYEVGLPVLEKYNIKGFWFIYSSVFKGEFEKFEIYRQFRVRCFRGIDEFYDVFFAKYNSCEFPKPNIRADSLSRKKFDLIKIQFPFYSDNDLAFRRIRDDLLTDQQYEQLMDDLIEEHGTSYSELGQNIWMTDSHLQKLSQNGHCIGMHAYNHPTALSKMPYNEQLEQYEKNFAHIQSVTGKKPVSISYPNNSYNKDTLTIMEKLNITCGFRSNMELIKHESDIENSLTIPRMDHSNIINSILRENSLFTSCL